MLFGSKNQPCKLIVHRFWSLQQTSQYAKYQTYKNIQDVYCVAVLQCCSSKNGCMKVWNELYIYIYRYRTIFCVWERLLENCNTATLQQNVVVSRFRLTVFTPFPSVVKKNQKKLSKNSWTAMTMLYLCTRKIEHAPACNRRSIFFESEGAVHVVTRKNRKKHPLPPPPFKVTIRMRLSKEKTEGEWNGKWLTFVLWQTYIHQKGTLFVQ